VAGAVAGAVRVVVVTPLGRRDTAARCPAQGPARLNGNDRYGCTTADALGQLAADAFVTALGRINIGCEPGADSDVVVRVDDTVVALDIRTTAYATPERVRAMLDRRRQNSATPLLVADHVTEAARQAAARHQWNGRDCGGQDRVR